jgi:hypothetical protein
MLGKQKNGKLDIKDPINKNRYLWKYFDLHRFLYFITERKLYFTRLVKRTEAERIPWKVKTKENIGRKDVQLAIKFDGEIHFYYPERHYHIVEIILKK